MTDGPADPAAVKAVLAAVKDPETGRSLMELGQLRDLRVDGDRVRLTLALTTHSAPLRQRTQEALRSLLLEKFPALKSVTIDPAVHQRPPEKLGQVGLTAKSVIAVGSGKGGVGKSSLAAYLACGLSRAGSRVGLLDADVYGPSIPHLFGADGRPEITEDRIEPIVARGVAIMSIGLLVPASEAVVWRGPMLHGAIAQFLRDTNWGDLDYLIVDMPPGTGDVALSLSQLLPPTGAVVVCTPQDLALLDAVKAIAMFRKVEIPVLGMVENMSGFVCPDCGKRYDIFGSGGAKKRAEELGVPFLGEVPIHTRIRECGDAGNVAAVLDHKSIGPCLDEIVYRLVENLAKAAAKEPPLPSLSVL